MTTTIWILDDDAELGALLQQQFIRGGLEARHLNHPRELESALRTAIPDVLVLDELLPMRRGTELLAHVRQKHPQLPVLMLSALGSPRDRIAGLEAGANDYLGKPFLFRELQLRVEQLLRASPPTPTQVQDQAWQLGTLRLDPQRFWLEKPDGNGQELSRGDMALLQLLCSRAGDVVSRQDLCQASGSLVDAQQSRSIDVRLSRLRRLLLELQPDQQMIETVRGQGYRLTVPVRRLEPGMV
jgi:DNA-binding response OmpR family regulator